MEEIREVAHLADDLAADVPRVGRQLARLLAVSERFKNAEVHLHGGEVLGGGVVQLSGDLAPLLVLEIHEAR